MSESLPFAPPSADIPLCDLCNASFFPVLPLNTWRTPEALRKIRDNYIPTHSEMDQMSMFIHEAKTDLTRVQHLLEKLEFQRNRLQTSIETYQCLQAPVRRLPTEVLSEIFLRCAPSHARDNLTSWNGLGHLSLGLVCRRWRDIALSLPNLWTTVSLDLDALRDRAVGFESHVQMIDPILKLYLERSRDCPLTVFVKAGDSFPEHRIADLVEDVVSQSHRWRSATVSFLGLYVDDCFPGPAGFPILEDLTILRSSFLTARRNFENCPRLHTLTLSAECERYANKHDFPWHQLQTLKIERGGLSLSNLRHCTQLVSLEIDTGISCKILYDDHIMSHIHSFSLSICPSDPDNDAELLDKFTLPSLKSFSINGTRYLFSSDIWPSSVWTTAFTSLLRRSACPLETLCIEDVKMAREDLLTILKAAPSTLTTLRLHKRTRHAIPVVTDTILRSLTYDSQTIDPPLLPRLTHLDLTVNAIVNDQVLLDMIESRWSPTAIHSSDSYGVACLESVALIESKYHPLEPSTIERLQRLGKEGLKVTVDGQRISLAST